MHKCIPYGGDEVDQEEEIVDFRINVKFRDLGNGTSTADFPIWGTVYVEYDGFCFPAEEWDDAVSSMFDMWLSEINRYVNTDCDRCELDFMDGPFVICLKRLPQDYVCVSLVKRPDEVQRKFIVPFDALIKELLKCVNLFLDECKAQSMRFVETNAFRRISENSISLGAL